MNILTPRVNELDNQIAWPQFKITLVEYGDYQCPACAMFQPAVKRLLKENAHDIRFVFRNFPLQTVHPYAMSAALAAEAAGRQNRFWEMHNLLFECQELFSDGIFIDLAGSIGLHLDLFQRDFTDESTHSKVNADFKSGIYSGVDRTPSFFVEDNRIELSEFGYPTLDSATEVYLRKASQTPLLQGQ